MECSLPRLDPRPGRHDRQAGIPLFTLLKIDSTHGDDVAARDKTPSTPHLPSHIGMQPGGRLRANSARMPSDVSFCDTVGGWGVDGWARWRTVRGEEVSKQQLAKAGAAINTMSHSFCGGHFLTAFIKANLIIWAP